MSLHQTIFTGQQVSCSKAKSTLDRAETRRLRIERTGAFSLVEMLTVLTITATLAALVLPALRPPGGVSGATYGIADMVKEARSYAVGNNTYVYMGFAEYDMSQPAYGPQVAGNGRVVVSAVATKDGTRGYSDTSGSNASTSWNSSYLAGADLVTVIKPTHFDNVHLTQLGTPPTTGSMARPDPQQYCLGPAFTSYSQTPFSLPLGSSLGNGMYNFNQILIFSPDGSVYCQTNGSNLGLTSPLYVEIDLQPNRGNTANIAAVSINGTTGASKVYRP